MREAAGLEAAAAPGADVVDPAPPGRAPGVPLGTPTGAYPAIPALSLPL